MNSHQTPLRYDDKTDKDLKFLMTCCGEERYYSKLSKNKAAKQAIQIAAGYIRKLFNRKKKNPSDWQDLCTVINEKLGTNISYWG